MYNPRDWALSAVKLAIPKGKGKGKAPASSPKKPKVAAKKKEEPKSVDNAEHMRWWTICASRIMDKMMVTDEGRAWVETGLHLFKADDVTDSDDPKRVASHELARQLMCCTDDEGEEEEEAEAEDAAEAEDDEEAEEEAEEDEDDDE